MRQLSALALILIGALIGEALVADVKVDSIYRTVVIDKYDATMPTLEPIKLKGIVDPVTAVRMTRCYGAVLPSICVTRCQGDVNQVEIHSCIHTKHEGMIFVQECGGVGVDIRGMVSIDGAVPHWCSDIEASICSQISAKEAFRIKYLQKSVLNLYGEQGGRPSRIEQSHDNQFNGSYGDNTIIDAYSAGLNTFNSRRLNDGTVIQRRRRPWSAVKDGKPWAVVASSGDDCEIVAGDYFSNAFVELHPESGDLKPIAGDGMEATAVITVTTPVPASVDTLIAMFRCYSGQEHDGIQWLKLTAGQSRCVLRARVIGGWESPATDGAHIRLAPSTMTPAGTVIQVDDLQVRHFTD